MLTDKHKSQQIGAAIFFLQHYHKKGKEFLDKIVMGGETWGAI